MQSDAIHIGFDLDGVLIDHTRVKVDLAAQQGITVPLKRTNTAFLRNYFPSEKDYRAYQAMLYEDPVVSLRSALMPGALETLRGLTEAGIRFTLVSRRREPRWAKKVLEHHGLRPRFFDDENTYFVQKPEEKNHVALRTGITHYIDDEPRVLRCLLDVPNRFLLDPYGAFPASDDYAIVRSHPEFIAYVTS